MKNNNFFRKINLEIFNLAAAFVFALASVMIALGKKTASITFLIVWFFIVAAFNIVTIILRKKEKISMIEHLNFYIGNDEYGNKNNCLKNYRQPLVFLDKDGKYIWANELFKEIFSGGREMKDAVKRLYSLNVKNKVELHEENINDEVVLGDKFYNMMCSIVAQKDDGTDDVYYMLYFSDNTEMTRLKTKYENERVAIGEIKIDSYEELYFTDGENIGNKAIAELGSRFDKWLEGKNAIVKRLSRDRYIFVVEDKSLKELEEDDFSILTDAKTINVQNSVPVTLSIGVSAYGESVTKNFEIAESALELALARGGDQAVVRINGKDTYYGGSNIDISNQNTVKSRIAADKLKKEIKKSSRVVIMGHSNPDMDAVGSALAVYRACCICGVSANIVLNTSNKSIDESYKKLINIPEYKSVFVNNTDILPRVDEKTLLVVVDTYTGKMTECPKLVELAERIAVIDHHRKGADFIKETVLDYSETYASSTSELMTEILQFIDMDIKIPVEEAEALYAGILVDTKNFVFKTGIKTFKAAEFLRSMGVDFINVKKFFLPDYETFSSISKVTSNAFIVSQKVAISTIDQTMKDGRFVAALAADRLLEISGIGASFILVDSPAGISISGRSLGEINVQVILEKMGGGGHLTAAGAFVKDMGIDEVKNILIKNIDEYFKA